MSEQAAFRFCDPSLAAVEKPRLSAQCSLILARLNRGVASNKELAALALKYTSRISDLRASGYAIEVLHRNYETGEVWYELKAKP